MIIISVLHIHPTEFDKPPPARPVNSSQYPPQGVPLRTPLGGTRGDARAQGAGCNLFLIRLVPVGGGYGPAPPGAVRMGASAIRCPPIMELPARGGGWPRNPDRFPKLSHRHPSIRSPAWHETSPPTVRLSLPGSSGRRLFGKIPKFSIRANAPSKALVQRVHFDVPLLWSYQRQVGGVEKFLKESRNCCIGVRDRQASRQGRPVAPVGQPSNPPPVGPVREISGPRAGFATTDRIPVLE